ncbi:DUF6932 family protein [Sphingomonas sp.]|uniref:DUF6932 family protein n=1 Tax=Sphingomonas sp. TaxID=28214 RepID=UPI0038B22CCB
MTIPAFDLGGVLPPFIGTEPGTFASQSPYKTTPEDLIIRFGSSPPRNEILRGLLTYRDQLRSAGLQEGFQWIDGSFVEDKEKTKGLAPGDVDVVTLFKRPSHLINDANWNPVATTLLPTLFDADYCKAHFHCDAYPIDLGGLSQNVAMLSAFWFSLFSHQRTTYRWKGIVQIPLGPAALDAAADAELRRRGA